MERLSDKRVDGTVENFVTVNLMFQDCVVDHVTEQHNPGAAVTDGVTDTMTNMNSISTRSVPEQEEIIDFDMID